MMLWHVPHSGLCCRSSWNSHILSSGLAGRWGKPCELVAAARLVIVMYGVEQARHLLWMTLRFSGQGMHRLRKQVTEEKDYRVN
jgi:hypothetical protein